MPRRLREMLVRDELSLNQYAVAALIFSSLDDRGEYVATLEALASACRWELALDTLRKRVLVRLRDKGLIDFESSAGQKKPYVFRPGREVLAEDSDEAPLSEVVSEVLSEVDLGQSEVDVAAVPHEHRDAPRTDPGRVRGRGVDRGEERREVRSNGLQDDACEADDAVASAEFEQAIEPILERGVLHPPQRQEAWRVWLGNRDELRVYVDEALKGHNPPALFAALVRDRPRRDDPRLRPPRKVDLLELLGGLVRNLARSDLPWDVVQGELEDRARLRRQTLSAEQLEQLRELWVEIRTAGGLATDAPEPENVPEPVKRSLSAADNEPRIAAHDEDPPADDELDEFLP